MPGELLGHVDFLPAGELLREGVDLGAAVRGGVAFLVAGFLDLGEAGAGAELGEFVPVVDGVFGGGFERPADQRGLGDCLC